MANHWHLKTSRHRVHQSLAQRRAHVWIRRHAASFLLHVSEHLLSLSHGVPVVGAGTREGKNDNNAHIDYFGLGINLRTEKPSPRRIRQAIDTVLREPRFKQNVDRVRLEFQRYDPHQIIDAHLAALPVAR